MLRDTSLCRDRCTPITTSIKPHSCDTDITACFADAHPSPFGGLADRAGSASRRGLLRPFLVLFNTRPFPSRLTTWRDGERGSILVLPQILPTSLSKKRSVMLLSIAAAVNSSRVSVCRRRLKNKPMAHAVCTVVLLLICTAAVHAAEEGTVGTETATAGESKDRAERARRVLSMPPRGGELVGSTTIDINDLCDLGVVVAFAIRQQPSAMVRLSAEELLKAETDGGSLPANADAILKFVVRDNTTANVEMQPLPKQLRRFYVAFSPWASVGMQEWMIWRSPRTPPISANALNYTQIGGWRERLRRWARTSSRPQMVVALFRERVFKTAVGARVELPATPGRGTFTIGLQNVSFGVTFALVVNEQLQNADAVVKRRGSKDSADIIHVASCGLGGYSRRGHRARFRSRGVFSRGRDAWQRRRARTLSPRRDAYRYLQQPPKGEVKRAERRRRGKRNYFNSKTRQLEDHDRRCVEADALLQSRG
jgi:hypothetical protein